MRLSHAQNIIVSVPTVTLIIALAVEFAAVHPDKVLAEVEVVDDRAGEDRGLRGGDKETAARRDPAIR